MKNEELLNVLTDASLTPEDMAKKIQAMSGQDVNNQKVKNSEEVKRLQERIDELESNGAKYKDYDELKKFHDDSIAKAEETQKLDFLKSMKVKDPYAKMVMSQIDWSKGVYDADKKTYIGLEEQFKTSKEAYKDLYESEGNVQTIKFEGSNGRSETPQSSTNGSMNNFIRGIKAN